MQHEQHGAAAAVWAALAAIGATDADAGEWLAEEGGTLRSFGSLDEWRAFMQRLLSGRARASVALDFPFADAGPGGLNLRGDKRLLERMFCFHDPEVGAPSDWLVVVHVHTLLEWGDRKKGVAGQPLREVTSVNVRHATQGAGGG